MRNFKRLRLDFLYAGELQNCFAIILEINLSLKKVLAITSHFSPEQVSFILLET